MEKIEIKSIWGSILFSHECENNSMKLTVEAANRSSAPLSGAELSGAELSGAELSGADLRSAVLRRADLSGSDLRRADLRNADLSGAALSGADLRNADLSGADLSGADLRNADLSGADLSWAYLSETTCMLLGQCPSEGSFIAWKKANGKIIKLKICEDAKRSSATTLKCRCSAALVLEIQNIDGSDSGLLEISSGHDSNFIYKVGKVASVDNFDENRFNECSSGIHFFIKREMAVAYK